ncbi:unnamed protein product [Calypogeia fissa]
MTIPLLLSLLVCQLLCSFIVRVEGYGSTFDPMCTRPSHSFNWVAAPDVRWTWGIVAPCLLTLLTCTVTIQHLNIPYESTTCKVKKVVNSSLSTVKWMVLAMLAPEFVYLKAMLDRYAAQSFELMKDFAIEDNVDWELEHGFYANMGGFWGIEAPDPRQQGPIDPIALSLYTIYWLRKNHKIEKLPDITTEELRDKSKKSIFLKLLSAAQLYWVFKELAQRLNSNLAYSHLEAAVSISALLAFNTFAHLWDRPQGITVPSRPIRCAPGSIKKAKESEGHLMVRSLFTPKWVAKKFFRISDWASDSLRRKWIPNDCIHFEFEKDGYVNPKVSTALLKAHFAWLVLSFQCYYICLGIPNEPKYLAYMWPISISLPSILLTTLIFPLLSKVIKKRSIGSYGVMESIWPMLKICFEYFSLASIAVVITGFAIVRHFAYFLPGVNFPLMTLGSLKGEVETGHLSFVSLPTLTAAVHLGIYVLCAAVSVRWYVLNWNWILRHKAREETRSSMSGQRSNIEMAPLDIEEAPGSDVELPSAPGRLVTSPQVCPESSLDNLPKVAAESNIGSTEVAAESNVGSTEVAAASNIGSTEVAAESNIGSTEVAAESNIGSTEVATESNIGSTEESNIGGTEVATVSTSGSEASSITGSARSATIKSVRSPSMEAAKTLSEAEEHTTDSNIANPNSENRAFHHGWWQIHPLWVGWNMSFGILYVLVRLFLVVEIFVRVPVLPADVYLPTTVNTASTVYFVLVLIVLAMGAYLK